MSAAPSVNNISFVVAAVVQKQRAKRGKSEVILSEAPTPQSSSVANDTDLSEREERGEREE